MIPARASTHCQSAKTNGQARAAQARSDDDRCETAASRPLPVGRSSSAAARTLAAWLRCIQVCLAARCLVLRGLRCVERA